jgi:hypothetical protein
VDKSRKSWALTPAEVTGWLRDKEAAFQEMVAGHYGPGAWRDTSMCYNETEIWSCPRVIMTGSLNQGIGGQEGVTEVHVNNYLWFDGNEVDYNRTFKSLSSARLHQLMSGGRGSGTQQYENKSYLDRLTYGLALSVMSVLMELLKLQD